ncbi:1666_t:CDS:2 [Scutellospora calospora]|uniref:1666_t:CDS:1 n=1 Tax=Scutellospora calospora TaxID=85575 RepID=A0ACA9KK09_9GLOM|nr:1666_t:CDS:2 [Scutellospora calospora]
MDSIQERLKYFNAQADKELSKYPQICALEKQTNVPKTYMAAGVVTFVFTLIFFNVWGELLSDVIGWLYPAYASFKAIESPETSDDVQWLTYWLLLPPFRGAQLIYSKFLRPTLLSYQGDIDKNLNNWKNKVDGVIKEAAHSAVDASSKLD